MKRSGLRLAGGGALLVTGAALLALGLRSTPAPGPAPAGSARAQTTDSAHVAPYRYELAAEPAQAADTQLREALAKASAFVHEARLVSNQDERALVRVQLAEGPQGRVLLTWDALVDDPFLLVSAPLQETLALADALHQHLPTDALVLAWWDVSRALELLGNTPVRFDQHLGSQPLAMPAAWRASQASITNIEESFWGPVEASATAAFDSWLDALLASPAEGVHRLQAQAQGRKLFVVLHVRDALLLGSMRPDRIGIAFTDQPDAGNLHGSINSARNWVREHAYTAYTAYRLSETRLRLVALTDGKSQDTLFGQLLPFHDPRQERKAVAGLTLVHQVGGYWVYRLDASGGERSAAGSIVAPPPLAAQASAR